MRRQTWIVTAIWISAAAVCTAQPERLEIVILDQVDVESTEMAYATDLGRRLFDILGVETAWTVCHRGQPCPMPPPGAYLRLVVVPWTKGSALGFASTDSMTSNSPQAYAFYLPVTRLAKRTEQPLGTALACVMVHEALHLLGLEHASFGIMREKFDTQDLANVTRNPLLSATQIMQLRHGLGRRKAVRLTAER